MANLSEVSGRQVGERSSAPPGPRLRTQRSLPSMRFTATSVRLNGDFAPSGAELNVKRAVSPQRVRAGIK